MKTLEDLATEILEDCMNGTSVSNIMHTIEENEEVIFALVHKKATERLDPENFSNINKALNQMANNREIEWNVF